jgi:hypothetical protein
MDDADEKWNGFSGKSQRQSVDFPIRMRDIGKVASDCGIVIYSNLHGLCKNLHFTAMSMVLQGDQARNLSTANERE